MSKTAPWAVGTKSMPTTACVCCIPLIVSRFLRSLIGPVWSIGRAAAAALARSLLTSTSKLGVTETAAGGFSARRPAATPHVPARSPAIPRKARRLMKGKLLPGVTRWNIGRRPARGLLGLGRTDAEYCAVGPNGAIVPDEPAYRLRAWACYSRRGRKKRHGRNNSVVVRLVEGAAPGEREET